MADHDDYEDKQFPDNDVFVPYVTDSCNLAQRNGAKVIIWGKIIKVSPSEGFSIKTVDDQEVLIRLKSPVNEPLEGWYEIHGMSQGKSILCDEYVPFSAEMAKNVDIEGHKAFVKLLSALDDPWNLGDENSGMGGIERMQ